MNQQSFFIGRQRELAALWEAFAQADRRQPIASLVYGEPGVGKTTIMNHFLSSLRSSHPDALVLTAACDPICPKPFQVINIILDTLCSQLQGMSSGQAPLYKLKYAEFLLRIFPELGQHKVLAPASTAETKAIDANEQLYMAFLGLRELITLLAESHPVVLFIDNIQWVDADSIRQLRSLLHPPGAPSICMLASLDTSTGTWDAKQEARQVAQQFPRNVSEIEVSTLSMEEARELSLSMLDASTGESNVPNERLAQDIARESRGHPLFIQQLISQMRTNNQWAFIPGQDLSQVLRNRLSTLKSSARNLVELVSVSGTHISQSNAATAAGLTSSELTQHADMLCRSDLLRTRDNHTVGDLAPSHECIRTITLDQLPVDERTRWHQRLAHALKDNESVEPELLSLHFEGAGDTASAAKYARIAAARAEEALAFDRAAGLYRKAVDGWSGDYEERRRLQIRLGDTLARTGRGYKAGQAFLNAVAGAEAHQALDLEQRAGEQLLRAGHIEDGLASMNRVLSSLGMRMPKTSRGALISLLFRRLQIRLRGLRFKERRESQLPAAQLVRVDTCRAVGQILSTIDHIVGADFNTRYVLEALSAGEIRRVLYALATEASFVAASGGIQSRYFRKIISEVESLLKRRDEPMARVYLATNVSLGAFMSGEWRIARESSEHAESLFGITAAGMTWEVTFIRSLILWSLYYLGELDEMAQRVPAVVQGALDRGDLYTASHMLMGLPNIVWLNQEGPQRARHHISAVMRRWSSKGFHLQHYYAMLAETNIDLYQGEGIRAYERISTDWPSLHRSLLLQLPSVGSEGRHLRARSALAAAVEADTLMQKSLLSQAEKDAKYLTRRKQGWTGALALLIRAAVANIKGDTKKAIHQLESAVKELETCEMRLYAAAAHLRLSKMISGEEGAAHLEKATSFMSKQGVSEPQQMAAMLLPGFTG